VATNPRLFPDVNRTGENVIADAHCHNARELRLGAANLHGVFGLDE